MTVQQKVDFDMYALFVESSYKVTEWRHSANNFFLSLNAATLAVVGFGWQEKVPYFDKLILIVPVFMFLVCCLWVRLLLALKSLNSAKFRVIEDMERLMGAYTPFTREWDYIKKKKGLFGYHSLSNLESAIALAIALFHFLVAIWLYKFGLPST